MCITTICSSRDQVYHLCENNALISEVLQKKHSPGLPLFQTNNNIFFFEISSSLDANEQGFDDGAEDSSATLLRKQNFSQTFQ